MQCTHEVSIQLKKRFSACADDKRTRGMARVPTRPKETGGMCKAFCRQKLAAATPISSDKIGITETASGAQSVFLAARPQVASSKSTENSRATCIGAFSLQRVK